MSFPYPGTIPSDMCSSTQDTHFASLDRETHFTSDMCSPTREYISLVECVFPIREQFLEI